MLVFVSVINKYVREREREILFCLNVFLSNKYQENKQVKQNLQRFAEISG